MRAVTPETWSQQLSAPPIVNSGGANWRSGLLRRWRGTDSAMSQPPLDHHYVVLHLGGPKRVTRSCEGGSVTTDVEENAITIVPAGSHYEWTTSGPIDFAHLYCHPARLNHSIAMMFEQDACSVTLDGAVGVIDPLITATMQAMLAELEKGGRFGRPYLDALFDAVVATLACKHSSPGGGAPPATQVLAPVRLRRVLDHIEAALGDPIDLAQLAQVAGLSRFHFSRAFHNAMGEPPLAYVTRRRLEAAKRALRGTETPLSEIAKRTGFGSPSHFAETFKRHTGLPPSVFRRQL